MEQKTIKNLATNAKTIKVSGQALSPKCLEDCLNEVKVLVTYPAPYSGCYKSEYKVIDSFYNSKYTSAF